MSTPSQLIEALDASLRRARPDFESRMRPPADRNAIEQVIAELHLPLPEEFTQLFLWHDGSDLDAAFPQNLYHDRMHLLPVEGVLKQKKMMDDFLEQGKFDKWKEGEWWNTAWVPLLDDHSSRSLVIDTTGAFDGKPGQIVQWCNDWNARWIVASSFEKWLRGFCLLLDEGFFVNDGDGFHVQYHLEQEAKELTASIDPGFPRFAEASER